MRRDSEVLVNVDNGGGKEVVSTLKTCHSMSAVSEDDGLDRQIDREVITQCVPKLTRLGDVGGVI